MRTSCSCADLLSHQLRTVRDIHYLSALLQPAHNSLDEGTAGQGDVHFSQQGGSAGPETGEQRTLSGSWSLARSYWSRALSPTLLKKPRASRSASRPWSWDPLDSLHTGISQGGWGQQHPSTHPWRQQ